jgi:hypothetical protein
MARLVVLAMVVLAMVVFAMARAMLGARPL